MNRAVLVSLLAVLAFAAGLGVAWRLGTERAEPAGDAPPRIAGDFALLDTAGRTVSWREIGGRRQLVFFGFTHCPEVCPTTLTNASRALEDLGAAAAGMRVVLISVDPERDTSAALGDYVGRFGPQVVGFTGDAAGIDAAAAAFGVFHEKMPAPAGGDYMVNHTASLFLLGERDEILEIIPTGATPAEIAAALRRHPRA